MFSDAISSNSEMQMTDDEEKLPNENVEERRVRTAQQREKSKVIASFK